MYIYHIAIIYFNTWSVNECHEMKSGSVSSTVVVLESDWLRLDTVRL